MENLKFKISEFIGNKYNGSYRFIKDKMFISQFGNESYQLILDETNFLNNTKYAFSVRVRTFVEGIKDSPKCKVCGKLTIFNSNNGWQSSCSRTCHLKSEDRMIKLKQTNLKKYGSTNYLASDEGKVKTKLTNILKYGVDNYAKSEEFKQKIRNK
jgi:hypothetical protein